MSRNVPASDKPAGEIVVTCCHVRAIHMPDPLLTGRGFHAPASLRHIVNLRHLLHKTGASLCASLLGCEP